MASMPPFHMDLTATDHATPVVQRLTQANQRLSQSIDAQGGFFTRNRRAMQQFGFQAGDVAVQVAGGQSAMLAFTQQGSQMLQFFGAGGALAGAFVAVIGSLAIALTKSGALTISSADAMKRLGENVKEASEQYQALTKSIETQQTLSGLNSPAASSLGVLASQDIKRQMEDFQNTIGKGLIEVGKVADVEAKLTGLGAVFQRLMEDITFGWTGASDSLTEQIEGIREYESTMKSVKGTVGELMKAIGNEDADRVVAMWVELNAQVDQMGEGAEQVRAAMEEFRPVLDDVLEYFRFSADQLEEMSKEAEKNRKILSDTLTIGRDILNTATERVKTAWAQAKAYQSQKAQVVALYNTTSGLLHLENERRRAAEAQAKIDALGPQGNAQTGRGSLGTTMAEWQNRDVDAFNKKWEATQKTIRATGGSVSSVTEEVKELTYELTQAGREAETLASSISSTIGSELLSMSDRTKTVADAFRSMARDIIRQLYDVLVVQRLVGSWSIDSATGTGSGSGLMGVLMQGIGSLFGGSRMATPSFAGGGYTGNGGRSGGLDGRGGFAAILHPNETVVDHTKGGGGETVVQNITINAMSDGDIDRVLAKRMPQLKNAMLGAVRNERRRGALV